MASPDLGSRSRLFGTVTRRERWGLSWRGVTLLAAFVAGVSATWFFGVYPFLAVTDRLETKLLVVEGWIDLYAIRAAAAEFRSGHYEKAFSTGGPVHGMGGYTNDYNTAASVGVSLLRDAGLPESSLQMVPSRVSARDRTYSSAVALRVWCSEHGVPLRAVNVVTEDVHARRTRLLFQKALGPDVRVGVIAVPNPDYDAGHWWKYSEGVRAVLGECIAYIYARCFFFPEPSEKTEKSVAGATHG